MSNQFKLDTRGKFWEVKATSTMLTISTLGCLLVYKYMGLAPYTNGLTHMETDFLIWLQKGLHIDCIQIHHCQFKCMIGPASDDIPSSSPPPPLFSPSNFTLLPLLLLLYYYYCHHHWQHYIFTFVLENVTQWGFNACTGWPAHPLSGRCIHLQWNYCKNSSLSGLLLIISDCQGIFNACTWTLFFSENAVCLNMLCILKSRIDLYKIRLAYSAAQLLKKLPQRIRCITIPLTYYTIGACYYRRDQEEIMSVNINDP